MNRFNQYFNGNFSGCKLVATGYDPHRERDVRMYLMPGHVDVLGVTDTVDCWIAPLSSPFLEKVAKAVASHFAGDNAAFPVIIGSHPGAPEAPQGRVRLRASVSVTPQPNAAPVRVRIIKESLPCANVTSSTRVRIAR